MGETLLTGLLAWEGAGPEQLAVVEKLTDRGRSGERQCLGVTIGAEPLETEGAVIAVKPADVESVCAAVAGAGCERVLSIAAGVPLARLEGALGAGIAVVRAMPNTPAL